MSAQKKRAAPSAARSFALYQRTRRTCLVSVVLRLVRSVDRNADVLGLLGRELRELDAQLVEVQPRDFFVELLRQHDDLPANLLGLRVQLELREHLVGE